MKRVKELGGKVVETYPIHLADWVLSGESDLTGIDCLILYGSISPLNRYQAAKLPVEVYLFDLED